MRPCANAAGNLARIDPPDDQRIRDEGSVATPRHRLRAHQHHALALRERQTPGQPLVERRRLHVVRIAAEARIPPSSVRRIASCVPQTSKARHVPIVNARIVQRGRQLAAIELWVVTRPRDRTHIDDTLNAVSAKETDEHVNRAREFDREDALLRGLRAFIFGFSSGPAKPGHPVLYRIPRLSAFDDKFLLQ